jgi:hypothetical protein
VDIQETQGKVQGAIGLWELILAHTSFACLLLSIVVGIGFALTAKFPIHANCTDRWATWWTRTASILAAFVTAVSTWPNNWRWAFAAGIALVTPVLWGILLFFIGLLRPAWKDTLAMRKLTFDDDTEDTDVRPAEPRPDAP